MGINYGDFFEFSGECSRTAQRGLRGGRVSAHNTQREAGDARQVGNHAQPIAKLRSLAPSPCSAGRLPPGLREVLRGGKAAATAEQARKRLFRRLYALLWVREAFSDSLLVSQ